MSKGIEVVFGGASIGAERVFKTEPQVEEVLEILGSNGVKEIDSAQLYAGSEELLGKVKAGSRFTLSTKARGGFMPGRSEKDDLVHDAKESLRKLGVDRVDIFYIHAPDASVPLSSTLSGIQALHSAGHFQRFGLSNYQAADVVAVYEYMKAHSYVLPTVYQGNYSPVTRKQETLLFPTLRKLGISFYAYSPLAGGFLVKTKEQILAGAGRFDANSQIGKIYQRMYARPAYLEALAEWEAIAEEAGCSKADLAYRWVKYNCVLDAEHGDAVIIGASRVEQLKQTLEGLNAGPLNESVVAKVDSLWKKLEHEAPLDNFNG
ncbi:Aflatoxin B1 aldehyde reductase member 2 [Schaereria dolodes]|nr:Aflatoxin B1 aldehyde reductase member 2 [Schaereria dolodes]